MTAIGVAFYTSKTAQMPKYRCFPIPAFYTLPRKLGALQSSSQLSQPPRRAKIGALPSAASPSITRRQVLTKGTIIIRIMTINKAFQLLQIMPAAGYFQCKTYIISEKSSVSEEMIEIETGDGQTNKANPGTGWENKTQKKGKE